MVQIFLDKPSLQASFFLVCIESSFSCIEQNEDLYWYCFWYFYFFLVFNKFFSLGDEIASDSFPQRDVDDLVYEIETKVSLFLPG
jgi:hypothetical protein